MRAIGIGNPAITLSEFDAWLLAALPLEKIAYLDGEFSPRNFPISRHVRQAFEAGLVHIYFNANLRRPAYMAQRTTKPLPPHLSARIGGPSPLAPADAEAVLAAVECSVGARGLLPPLTQISAAAHTPLHRVRAAIDWLIAHGLIIISNLIIGTQRRRYVILS